VKRALLCLLLSGCAEKAAVFGEQLFNDPQFAGSLYNQASCGTCHAVWEGDRRILPGATMVDAVNRPSYWGGKELRLIDAVSFCYINFMGGPGPLLPEEPRSRALYEYLLTLSRTEHPPPVPLTLTLNAAEVPPGDKRRGEAVYRDACETCHGQAHTGQGRNSPLASILPDVADEYGAIFPGVQPRLVFVEKVRHGPFFGVGGTMPFFSKEVLSDADLGALLVYLFGE
jgi:thiosulfate dehydrogenase